ncbi:MAG: Gfo/Idh/MocA family oxidoreductase, partial [Rhodothermales bacterium]|nr:Gfo/Idh/MocA family oxidoreductase [Rhodothermales bacterium]
MKIIVAGGGAFGIKHLNGIKNIDGVEVAALVGRRPEPTSKLAAEHGIPEAFTSLDEALALPGIEAAILCTPTQMHASQAIQCMRAGLHVEVEIPVADSWKAAREVDRVQKETGLVCMVGHTRRFNPSHQWVHNKIVAGELSIQQMDVQTYF